MADSVKGGSPGAREAERAFTKLRKGKPSEADRPPPSVFPGRKIKLLDGQIDLEGNVYTAPTRRKKRRPDEEFEHDLVQAERDLEPWVL